MSRVSIYLLLYMFVCIVNLLSCFSSLAVCLFSLASIPYTYLYVIPMPPCIYFTEFFILPVPSRPLFLYQPLLPHIPYPAPRSGKGSEEWYRSFPINLQLLSVCFYVQNSTSIILPCHELHYVAPSLRIPVIYNVVCLVGSTPNLLYSYHQILFYLLALSLSLPPLLSSLTFSFYPSHPHPHPLALGSSAFSLSALGR